LHFAVGAGYLEPGDARLLFTEYDRIIGAIVAVEGNPKYWLLK